jgi:hypothetical protein
VKAQISASEFPYRLSGKIPHGCFAHRLFEPPIQISVVGSPALRWFSFGVSVMLNNAVLTASRSRGAFTTSPSDAAGTGSSVVHSASRMLSALPTGPSPLPKSPTTSARGAEPSPSSRAPREHDPSCERRRTPTLPGLDGDDGGRGAGCSSSLLDSSSNSPRSSSLLHRRQRVRFPRARLAVRARLRHPRRPRPFLPSDSVKRLDLHLLFVAPREVDSEPLPLLLSHPVNQVLPTLLLTASRRF